MMFDFPDEAFTAANKFVIWTTLFLVAMTMARLIYERWPPSMMDKLDRIIMGAGLHAGAWGFRQFYYWVQDMAKLAGVEVTWKWLDPAIIAVAFVGIITGSALMLSPLSERVFGERWKLVSLSIVSALWISGFLAATRA